MASITNYSNRFAIFSEDIDTEKNPFETKTKGETNLSNVAQTDTLDTNNRQEYNPFRRQQTRDNSDEYNPFNRKKNNNRQGDLDEHNPFRKKTYDNRQNNSDEHNPFGRKKHDDYVPPYRSKPVEGPKKPVVPTNEQFPSLQKAVKEVPKVSITPTIGAVVGTVGITKDKSFAGIMRGWKEREDEEQRQLYEAQQEHERRLEEETKRFKGEKIHMGTFICPKNSESTNKKKKFIKRIVYDKDGKFLGDFDYKFSDINIEEGESYEDFYDEGMTELEEEQEYLRGRIGEDAFSDDDFEETPWEDEMEQRRQEQEEDEETDDEEFNQEIEDRYYHSRRG